MGTHPETVSGQTLPYRHHQRGTPITALLTTAELILIGLVFSTGPTRTTVLLLVVVTAVLAVLFVLFLRMTVEVDEQTIAVSLLLGAWRNSWRVVDLAAAELVPISRRYGLGVHGFRGNWLFNVSGRRGVRLSFADGRKVVIGSDEPERLLAALRVARLTE